MGLGETVRYSRWWSDDEPLESMESLWPAPPDGPVSKVTVSWRHGYVVRMLEGAQFTREIEFPIDDRFDFFVATQVAAEYLARANGIEA